MRRRIVLANVLVTAAALLLFTVLVAWVSAGRVVRSQRDLARVDANRIALGVNARIGAGQPITPAALIGFDRSDASVDVTVSQAPASKQRVIMLGTPTSDQRITAVSDLPGPSVVTVHTTGDSFSTALFRVGGVLVIICFIVVGVAALVARRVANTLVEPVRDLALVAARLGTGDPRPARRRYGIGELDAVAEVLDASAQRIGEQLAAERQLAADVSHQLRTPLTALSMRLEEVIRTDDPAVARSEATIALQQVERLSGVVDDLLAFARHTVGTQAEVDVDAVLAQQLDEWRGAYSAQARTLRMSGQPHLAAWVSTSALSQVVATLLENALVHGRGSTLVRTRTTGGSVVIEVSDEGDGVPAALARHIFDRDVSGASRSGLGLAVARALTEAEGGRLELIHARPATFALFLAATPSGGGATDETPTGIAVDAGVRTQA